ncbi:hypothetical protein EJ02DRAFT_449352 [Clathrospora elynae]|uniref:Uncharacterized protein n=1 Tax=Clathrospora elynae TaxID=706981 RepID=A0A6A5T4G4_9PLEO|nr:hypothetical protein EJ02DRAFT_449352 [Clathrospora elynae]
MRDIPEGVHLTERMSPSVSNPTGRYSSHSRPSDSPLALTAGTLRVFKRTDM